MLFPLKWWHPFQHRRSRLRKPTFSWKRFIIYNQWEKVGLRLKLGETKSCGSLWRGNGQKAAGHQSCCRRLQGQIFRVITWSWNPPPPMEISTVGHRPRFAFTPSCNIKHLIYCRPNSSLVCETLLTLILSRFLTWAQKFPRLGFGGHTMQRRLSCHWLGRELLILSPFHLDLFSLCDFFFKDPYLLQLEFSGCSMKWKCSSMEKKIDSQSSQSAFHRG